MAFIVFDEDCAAGKRVRERNHLRGKIYTVSYECVSHFIDRGNCF